VSYKDFYQLLGVERTASQDEIQKAFKKLARKLHPDVNKEPGAEERFKEVNEAYEALKDPEKRKLYDKYGASWKAISEGRQPPPGAQQFDFRDFGGMGGMDPNDMSSIFEQFFGATQTRGGRRGRGPRAGQDHETQLALTVREAYEGGPRELTLRDADGEVTRLTVKIPSGVRAGQKIRLAGRGGPGTGGGPAGDLLLEVKLLSNDEFRFDGDDLYTPLRISPWEAALGAKVQLRTLDGEVAIKVPAGSSSGRNIRLREKGYPKADKSRGDLYATILVAVPESLTGEEKELFERLASTSRFDPRA
jgi:curved DNA-binding protein